MKMIGGLVTAFVVVLLDQASKYLFLYEVPLAANPIEVSSFLNLLMVWNPGVSFGLFPADSDAGRWLLIAVALSIVGYIGWWMRQSQGTLLVMCQGLVIGGAIGNVIDRLIYGAVFDFIDFHISEWHWPAFNVADAAICIGVAGLLLDSLMTARHDRAQSVEENVDA